MTRGALPGDALARTTALVEEFLLPLAAGGTVRLRRPFGPALATALSEVVSELAPAVSGALAEVRLRAARELVPIDDAPDLTGHELALGCALHDLLQATNPALSGPLTQERHARLVRGARTVVRRVAAPETLREALGRHTLFRRALQLTRVDTAVSWWTGSRRYVGTAPPARVLMWPSLRNVEVARTPVPLASMAEDGPGELDDFEDTLAAWLQRSPLTALVHASRAGLAFRWTPEILRVVGNPAGSSLALRALTSPWRPHELEAVRADLLAAADELTDEPRRMAERFLGELGHAMAAGWT